MDGALSGGTGAARLWPSPVMEGKAVGGRPSLRSGERIASLEAKMQHGERVLAAIRTKTDAIHEVVVEHRGFTRAMRAIGHIVTVMLGRLGGAIAHKVLGS
jgi:hypothetical protein